MLCINLSLQGKKWTECRGSCSGPQENGRESTGGTGLGGGGGEAEKRHVRWVLEGLLGLAAGLGLSAKKREIYT